jgi:carboxymethylenebutenolidase|tara:strand:+ start:4666 stop:5301 length:636 start_codon:yes stop_codon:yes gene_type:complete
MAEMQRRKIGSRAFPAFLSGQVGQPAVIVLQEWWGVTDMIKEHALKIAAQGYRVLIPDVYKGKLGVDKEEAHHLMSNLDFPAAVVEIGDAASYLKEEGAPHVGVVGFCMGGALALGAAAKSANITAAAPFYGVNFGLFSAEELVGTAIQGHFGREDKMMGFSDAATGEKLEATLSAAGVEAQTFIYDKVRRAYMYIFRPMAYALLECCIKY